MWEKYKVKKMDEDNYIIVQMKTHREGDKKGETYEYLVGHYSRIDTALKALLKMKVLKNDEIFDAQTVLNRIDEFDAKIDEILTNKPKKKWIKR